MWFLFYCLLFCAFSLNTCESEGTRNGPWVGSDAFGEEDYHNMGEMKPERENNGGKGVQAGRGVLGMGK